MSARQPCVPYVGEWQAFGAFCSELRDRASDSFYGVGETFLFALERLVLPALPERQLSSPSPSKGAHSTVSVTPFRWSAPRADSTDSSPRGPLAQARADFTSDG